MAAKKRSNIFVWILLGMIFVGLVGFGATGLSGTVRTLGNVGAKQVLVNDYFRDMNQQMRAFSAQIGSNVTFAQAQQLGMDRNVLAQLVSRRALDNEVARLGLSTGDASVLEQLQSISAFAGFDGQFSRDAYKSWLSQNGYTETEFETGLREEIARTLLQAGIVAGVAEPVTFTDVMLNFVAEQRAITWASVDATSLATPLAEPTEAELRAYYDAHAADFTTPETKEISYVWLTPEMIQDDVVIDDAALQELYDQRIDDFMKPERRLVERLAFVDEAAAATAAGSIASGEKTFEQLVSERGLDLADVDMGDVDQAGLGEAGAGVFGAETGAVVGPFKSNLGPALFRVNAVLAAEETSFEAAKPDLRIELANARARRVIDDARGLIEDLIAGGATLENLDEQTDLEIGKIDWNATTSSDIAAYDSFRAAASEAKVGDYPSIVELDDGGIFALRLDAVHEPALQDMEDVADAVRQGWTEQATQTAVIASATTTAAEIGTDTDFGTLGLTASTEPALTRRGFVGGTPEMFMNVIFTMKPGETKVVDGDTYAVIVRLDSIGAPDMNDPQTEANRTAIAEQVKSGIAQDLFDIFAGSIQVATEVNINQAAVNAVNAQFQ